MQFSANLKLTDEARIFGVRPLGQQRAFVNQSKFHDWLAKIDFCVLPCFMGANERILVFGSSEGTIPYTCCHGILTNRLFTSSFQRLQGSTIPGPFHL